MNINLEFKSVVSKYDSEAIISTAQSLLLIAIRAAALAGNFDVSPELKDAKNILSGIQAIFTIRTTYKSALKIGQNFQKKGVKGSEKVILSLETAGATIRIASGTIGITRALATFKLIDLEQFSSALGNIPVFQTLGQVSSILTIVTSVIDITIESIKIHERSKKIDRLKDKALAWKQPLALDLVQRKIAKQTQIHDAFVEKIDTLSQDILDTQDLQNTARTEYSDQKAKHTKKKGFGKLRTWRELKTKKNTLHKLNAKEKSCTKELEKTNAKEAQSLEKLTAWNKINDKWDTLSDEDNQALAQFQADKLAKWKGRTKSMKIDQLKAGIGLGLKIAGLALAIVALVLSFTGVGIVPVLATMAALSLTLAVVNLGFMLVKRHTSPATWESVPVPLLAD